jgi:uncharacterized integral membrane protein
MNALGEYMKISREIKDKLRGTCKGQMNIIAAFVSIGVALLVAAFVVLILSNVGDSLGAGTAAANVTNVGVSTINSMVNLTNPLGIVLIAAVIIGVLVSAFVFGGGQQNK